MINRQLIIASCAFASLVVSLVVAGPGPGVANWNEITTSPVPSPAAPLTPTVEERTKKVAPFPTTVAEAKAVAAAAALPVESWPASDVSAARDRCAAILKKIDAIAIPLDPIKDGACGTPAPIQLISIGRSPQVSISPPATVTCDLAEALATWLSKDLQPLAKKHLGGAIIRVENMSSYSCRNVYGRRNARLSEHGRANALDIRGFVTSSGKSAVVLSDWGDTQREIRARVAAKAANEKKARLAEQAKRKVIAEKAKGKELAEQAKRKELAEQQTREAVAGALKPTQPPEVSVSVPGLASDGAEPRATFSFSLPPGYSFGGANKLGGPKPAGGGPKAEPAASNTFIVTVKPGPKAVASAASGPREAFLKQAHAAGCRLFGTTLGPELNKAHRNHLHVDMATRNFHRVCD